MQISESSVIADHMETHGNATLFALGALPYLSFLAFFTLTLFSFELPISWFAHRCGEVNLLQAVSVPSLEAARR
jgi:uncharacterized membrane protein